MSFHPELQKKSSFFLKLGRLFTQHLEYVEMNVLKPAMIHINRQQVDL